MDKDATRVVALAHRIVCLGRAFRHYAEEWTRLQDEGFVARSGAHQCRGESG